MESSIFKGKIYNIEFYHDSFINAVHLNIYI